MSDFDKWWQPTEEYVNTTTEYERQLNTFEAGRKAGLEEAAEIAEEDQMTRHIGNDLFTKHNIAATIRGRMR